MRRDGLTVAFETLNEQIIQDLGYLKVLLGSCVQRISPSKLQTSRFCICNLTSAESLILTPQIHGSPRMHTETPSWCSSNPAKRPVGPPFKLLDKDESVKIEAETCPQLLRHPHFRCFLVEDSRVLVSQLWLARSATTRVPSCNEFCRGRIMIRCCMQIQAVTTTRIWHS